MSKNDTRIKRIGKTVGWTSAIIVFLAILKYLRSPKQEGDIIQLILAQLPPMNAAELILYVLIFVCVYVVFVWLHWKRYPNSIPKTFRK
jgi:hypothetical protein